jgi:putative membrane protein insertion efficiency factor
MACPGTHRGVKADPVRHLLIALINFYKRWISPLLGPRCRFHPTCSSYARESLQQHGVLRGGWMACMRILRCAPWSAGGIDPVPSRFHWWPRPPAPGEAADCCDYNDASNGPGTGSQTQDRE